jgi:bifunctional non-homologous end joining protein LigD
MPLPSPMLAQSGPLPARGAWAFEPKWDGFRAVVSTDPFEMRSRRGWNMTPLVPELEQLPARGVFDGELVALRDAAPHFPDLCARMLHGNRAIGIALVIFDVLNHDGKPTASWPYHERRALLESLDLAGPHWHTSPTFQDGEALFVTVCESALEGVVAKRLSSRYLPGERGWLKIKNRDYWRYPDELAAAPERKYVRSLVNTASRCRR